MLELGDRSKISPVHLACPQAAEVRQWRSVLNRHDLDQSAASLADSGLGQCLSKPLKSDGVVPALHLYEVHARLNEPPPIGHPSLFLTKGAAGLPPGPGGQGGEIPPWV